MPASAHYRIDFMSIPELKEYIRSCHAKIGEATVREYHTGKFRLDKYSGAEAEAHFEKYVGYIRQARAALQRAHGSHRAFADRFEGDEDRAEHEARVRLMGGAK